MATIILVTTGDLVEKVLTFKSDTYLTFDCNPKKSRERFYDKKIITTLNKKFNYEQTQLFTI